MRNKNIQKMVISALLCAIGIIIPMFSPVKILLEPASFTLGSHVAIFIAMFISPGVAVAVALGTSVGFFLGGFPIVVVLRAVTHVAFSFCGAFILQKFANILQSVGKSMLLSLALGIVHSVCEVLVVMPFYFGQSMSTAYYAKGFVTSVILLVGVGTVIHSMVDFGIAYMIWRSLHLNKGLRLQQITKKS